MPIDVYSTCPGGTGKKVKFCCPDFVGELDKISRMIEGEQYAACLQHLQQLREQPAHRDRQCLLAFQAILLGVTGQMEAAETHAAAFLEKYPHNQVALAESSCWRRSDRTRLGPCITSNGRRPPPGAIGRGRCTPRDIFWPKSAWIKNDGSPPVDCCNFCSRPTIKIRMRRRCSWNFTLRPMCRCC